MIPQAPNAYERQAAKLRLIPDPSRNLRLYIGAVEHLGEISREPTTAEDRELRLKNVIAVEGKRWKALTETEQATARAALV